MGGFPSRIRDGATRSLAKFSYMYERLAHQCMSVALVPDMGYAAMLYMICGEVPDMDYVIYSIFYVFLYILSGPAMPSHKASDNCAEGPGWPKGPGPQHVQKHAKGPRRCPRPKGPGAQKGYQGAFGAL